MASREKQYNVLKLRLYPTSEQAELFEKTFGCCRYLWNQMLADQQRFYLETGVHFIPTPAKYKKGEIILALEKGILYGNMFLRRPLSLGHRRSRA